MPLETVCDPCLPETCCGCCDKKVGVIITTIISLILSIAVVSLYAIAQTTSVYGWSVFWILVVVAFDIVGLIGAIKSSARLARVYGYFNFLNLFITTIVLIAAPFALEAVMVQQCQDYVNKHSDISIDACKVSYTAKVTTSAVLGVIGLLINMYLTLVSWAYYRSLVKGGYDTELGNFRN